MRVHRRETCFNHIQESKFREDARYFLTAYATIVERSACRPSRIRIKFSRRDPCYYSAGKGEIEFAQQFNVPVDIILEPHLYVLFARELRNYG